MSPKDRLASAQARSRRVYLSIHKLPRGHCHRATVARIIREWKSGKRSRLG